MYNYNNQRKKQMWNTLNIRVNNNFHYDNLPNCIDRLIISSKEFLNLQNLPINLKILEINSYFANPIWKMQQWKIPFACEIYYNGKLMNN